MNGFCKFFLMAAMIFALMPPARADSRDASVEELKSRVASTGITQRPGLCIQISELQLEAASKAYGEGDSEKAQASLTDVTAFAQLARDYAIHSHRGEKQSEIAIRKMARKLADLKHSAAHDDQKPIQETIDRLEKIRDDLLAAMFPKGIKK
jgi:hypothetical protein